MRTVAVVLTALVAAIHVYIVFLEMVAWTTPRGRAAFGTTPEFAEQSRTLPYAPPSRIHFVDAGGGLHLRPFVYAWRPDPSGEFDRYVDAPRVGIAAVRGARVVVLAPAVSVRTSRNTFAHAAVAARARETGSTSGPASPGYIASLPRHFLTGSELTRGDLDALLDRAAALKA